LQEQPRVSDVVLVADYNTPRRRWPLGQIVELLTCSDWLARSAKVQTAAGGSLLEIPLVAPGFLSIRTCVYGYCSGLR
ncbi:hypothetical protein T01_14067, partial [Trichinella spiralis]